MLETLSIAAIVVAAGFLQGLTGFGFGLIALPLLGLFIPIKTVIPLVIMLAMFISLTLSVQLRNSIRMKTISVLFLATLPGIPVGVYALTHVSSDILSLVLGLLMVSFTTYQLVAKPEPRKLGYPSTLTAGFACGVLTGSISAGGPPVIIYSALQPWSKDEAKATLAFYFLISGCTVLATHAYTGFITDEVLSYFTVSFPALVIGIFSGTFAYKHISDHGYRKLAIGLVFLLGCMMVYKHI